MLSLAPLRRNLEAAVRDLGSRRPAIRAEAVRDLVEHAEAARERVIQALQGALQRDGEGSVRAEAALALADIHAVEALPALLVAVEDEDAYVRQMSVAALGEVGDPRATVRLTRALKDQRPEIRFQAVIAFPRVCREREEIFEALLEATRDEDALVCHIALRMIEEVGSRSAPEETPASQQDVRTGLADLPAEALERAHALLQHASARVRTAAAVLLARAGEGEDAKVCAGLAEVASGKLEGADREDEAAAIELCGELGVKGARRALERRAFGGVLGFGRDPLFWHARVALARMGDARAEKEILRELRAGDRDRRTLAVAAASRARLLSAKPVLLSMRGDARLADPEAVEEALGVLSSTAGSSTAGSVPE
ncbi:HEAT repeat domain-containing protein [Chondromyces apiculatus]|uniref:HEAT repeat protein n=1 Tax=Chondromyces apiculatus DSM 436 TaxID=1192034 RepID=A0A017TCE1_9BACT|nr:HEAT repeat domain-containing protein [Chondromyces apiculatus]EYF06296.1 HEAT repeat protein [Chondromyces apiculatus DSM 436]